MVSEFNLSDERKKLFNPVFLPLNRYDKETMKEVEKIIEMQDKEFIKRLRAKHPKEDYFKLHENIDKLAGDDLK